MITSRPQYPSNIWRFLSPLIVQLWRRALCRFLTRLRKTFLQRGLDWHFSRLNLIIQILHRAPRWDSVVRQMMLTTAVKMPRWKLSGKKWALFLIWWRRTGFFFRLLFYFSGSRLDVWLHRPMICPHEGTKINTNKQIVKRNTAWDI